MRSKRWAVAAVSVMVALWAQAQVWSIGAQPQDEAKPKTEAKQQAKPAAGGGQQLPSFTIKGTIEGGKDGQKVYLARLEGNGLVYIDSAEVRGGTYSIKGRTPDVPQLRFIATQGKGRQVRTDFFLEPGNITVDLNTAGGIGRIDGSRHNRIYGEFKDSLVLINAAIVDQNRQLRDTTLTATGRSRIFGNIDSLKQVHYDCAARFAAANGDNNVGFLLLTEYYKKWTSPQLDGVVAALGKQFASLEAMNIICAYADHLRLSSPGSRFAPLPETTVTADSVAFDLSRAVGSKDYTLLFFWSPADRDALSDLLALKSIYARYRKERLEVVCFCLESDTTAWQQALERHSPPGIQVSDLKGNLSEAKTDYCVDALPLSILIDRNGTIVARNITPQQLRRKLTN